MLSLSHSRCTSRTCSSLAISDIRYSINLISHREKIRNRAYLGKDEEREVNTQTPLPFTPWDKEIPDHYNH